MLNIQLINSDVSAESILKQAGLQRVEGCAYCALMVDGTPVGIGGFCFDEALTIKVIAIIPQMRGKGYGDFLTRALLDRLSNYQSDIWVNFYSDYFLKFGFEKINNNKMMVKIASLHFPSKCKGD